MSTWFTSDWHIGHSNILKYCPKRPGGSVEEMGEIFIQNALDTVSTGDTLHMLGDVVMGDRKTNLEKLRPLKDAGIHLHLTSGNHDYSHPIGHKNFYEWTKIYEEIFDEVLCYATEEPIDDYNLILCHFPCEADHTEEDRYNQESVDKWRPKLAPHELLLHGHLHSETWYTGPQEIHVGIDADWTEFGVERFHPIHIDAIEAAFRSINEH